MQKITNYMQAYTSALLKSHTASDLRIAKSLAFYNI
jgi:hypothetical protein